MSERLFYVVLSVQIPTEIGGFANSDPASPVGFLPVFADEAAAKAYAGDRFTEKGSLAPKANSSPGFSRGRNSPHASANWRRSSPAGRRWSSARRRCPPASRAKRTTPT